MPNTMSIPTAITVEKAVRLVAEGQLTELREGVWLVESNDRGYIVTRVDTAIVEYFCAPIPGAIPHAAPCSHSHAAKLVDEQPNDPFSDL